MSIISAKNLHEGLSLILKAWPDARAFVDGDIFYVSAAKGDRSRIAGEEGSQLKKLGWTDGGDEWRCLLDTLE